MSVSESQLETWSHQGATTTAKTTHETIRRALAQHNWPTGHAPDTYLQGSYANDTNIYGDSDVDLVVEYQQIFYSNLTAAEKAALNLGTTTYSFHAFRADVLNAVTARFPGQVDANGPHSIKILKDAGRLPADVVPCVTYKHYKDLKVIAEGMTFWRQGSPATQVINYPRRHLANGTEKHSARHTNGWYKPLVRIMKNARNAATSASERHLFRSYFLECLLYNVPDQYFGGNYQLSYNRILDFLTTALMTTTSDTFTTQTGMESLFGNAPTQWQKASASALVARLRALRVS